MDKKIISSVSKQIQSDYPEVGDSQPKVVPYPDEKTLLIYNSTAETADGKKMKRTVRVMVDSKGKILKVSTSK